MNNLEISVLDKGYVQLIEHMGSDLSVVNAARCSFDKQRDFLLEDDIRLIHYLAREKHMLPFRHPTISLRVHMPIFVARQLGKHQIGFSMSEVSRRYVTGDPEFYEPEVWRKRPEASIKQGSGEDFSMGQQIDLVTKAFISHHRSLSIYKDLLSMGTAPEMARMILPQSMYTTVYWTGSLLGWNHLYKQRTDSHAQKETQEYGRAIGTIMEELFPVSWEALNEVYNVR
jgi:thymidylate synthase (FAD)